MKHAEKSNDFPNPNLEDQRQIPISLIIDGRR